MSAEVIDGFARCVNPACVELADDGTQSGGLYEVDRPIQLVKDTVAQKGYPGEAFSSMVITESSYVHAADDQDLICPDCGAPCSVIDSKPHVWPKAMVR